MLLENKVALVTGAGLGGIGQGLAEGFLNEGCNVVYADIDTDSALKAAQASGYSSDRWMVLGVDVAAVASNEVCVASTINRFGRLDIFVPNAGVQCRKPFLEQSEADFDRLIDINLKGVFFGCQAVARQMARSGGGAIITISSNAAVCARPDVPAYGASKGGVAALTRHLAVDLAPYQIRVNSIAPGTVITNMTNKRMQDKDALANECSLTINGRVGTPEDIAGAAIFLASDYSLHITGHMIFVEGGEVVK
ncbi:dehydrogenase [Betaproteobacteria bacterium]|nr:dehydrogenase [Betaproteobacteria bacterium]